MIIIYFFLFYEENFILIHKHKIRKVSQTICVIYVKNVSLYLDFYILLKTIGNIFSSLFVRKKRAIESLDYKKDFLKNYKI